MARKVKKSKKKAKAKKVAKRTKKKTKRLPAKKASAKKGTKRPRKVKPAKAAKVPDKKHPGMMGDGTEEQDLNQPGNSKARIKQDEVDDVFRTEKK
jgi:hypothetical protein